MAGEGSMVAKLVRKGALAGAGAALGAIVARRLRAAPSAHSGWLVVTVNAEPSQVSADPQLADAVARLDADVETRIDPAPGGRGTEVAVRVRGAPPGAGVQRRVVGDDRSQELRRVLRDVKSLIETGEVMRPDAPPTTGKGTPGGKIVRLATRRAGGEGRL